MPVIPTAPLPLKVSVGELVGEVVVVVPVKGVGVLVGPELVVVVLFPGVVVVVVEGTGSPMSNTPVWESVVVTSPTGEAWKV